MPAVHLQQTQLSAPLHSEATGTLKLAVSTPLYHPQRPDHFLGVLVVTVEVGEFLKKFAATHDQFAVLVDGRDNGFQGVILYHPLFARVFEEDGRLPDRFMDYRVPLEEDQLAGPNYRDPLGADPRGQLYNRPWIAARADVEMPEDRTDQNGAAAPSGLLVLIQQDQRASLQPVANLGQRLAREGAFALGGILLVVFLLWYFVFRVVGEPRIWPSASNGTASTSHTPSPSQAHSTVRLPAATGDPSR
jgi:hypothetical protein